jgi:hypothetical protein
MPIIADEMLALRSNSGRPDEQIPLRINEALGRALSKELTRAMYIAAEPNPCPRPLCIGMQR